LQVWITTSDSANRGRHAAHAAVLGSIGAVLTETSKPPAAVKTPRNRTVVCFQSWLLIHQQ
jgi:hypothetical protein